jgi:hypothetical protein
VEATAAVVVTAPAPTLVVGVVLAPTVEAVVVDPTAVAVAAAPIAVVVALTAPGAFVAAVVVPKVAAVTAASTRFVEEPVDFEV